MPERSFGRSVRYRRTKLGLSQSQLGELVGRSASSIRSWERDVSTPTDASVLIALSAILDLDQTTLFEKAGVELPEEESHPTVEQALASLAPLPFAEPELEQSPEVLLTLEDEDPSVSIEEDGSIVVEPAPGPFEEDEPELDADSELEAEVREHLEAAAVVRAPLREPDEEFETFKPRPIPVGVADVRRNPEPAFVAPPEQFLMTAPTPPVVEPSYMEDSEQRQLYRVRTLATVVLIVGLVVVFLWSMSNAVDALGEWWESFFGGLRF
jgi:transcriptional regulator with XRE-family HTH domain